MKRVLALVLTLVLCFSLAACGAKKEEPAKTETTLRRASAFEPNNKERKHKR